MKSRHCARSQAALRRRSTGPSSPPKADRRSARRTPSGGSASTSCSQRPNASSNSRADAGSVRTSKSGSTPASTGRSRSRSAQNAVNRADVRLFELRQRLVEQRAFTAVTCSQARVVEALPQPELQLAGGLLRERDSDDVADLRLALGDDPDDPADERCRLARARRGLDDERRVEGRRDELACLEIGDRVARSSWHASKRGEITERIGGLPGDVPRLVGAADRSEVAPAAGALGRRRRQKAELDRAVDDLERLEPGAAIRVGERHGMLGKSSRRRRVEEPAFPDRAAENLLDGQTVDHWLKRSAAADDRSRRRAVAAGLVVGDAQLRRSLSRLDDVHRARAG